MKYPKINNQSLDSINKKRFLSLYETIYKQIIFDNKESELNLTRSDMDLIAWNSAIMIISQPY